MKLDIDCSYDKVNKYVETEVLVDNVAVLEGDFFEPAKLSDARSIINLKSDYGCSKFINKAIKMLTLMAQINTSKNLYTVSQVTTLSNCTFETCEIVRNKDSEFLFEMFSKLGIYINNLTIGINRLENTLYINNKLLREISRLAEEGKRMLTMYLYSLAYFLTSLTVTKSIRDNAVFVYDAIASTLVLSESFYKDFPALIYSFNVENLTITLSEIPTEDFREVKFFRTAYTTPTFKYSKAYDVRMALLKKDIDDSYYYAIFTGDGENPITLVDIINQTIYTTDSVCYLDLTSSYITALLQTFEFGYKLVYTSESELLDLLHRNSNIFKILGNIEDNVTNISVNKELKYLCKDGVYPVTPFMNIVDYDKKDIEHLSKQYSITIEKDKSVVDSTTIEDMYKDDEYAQQLYNQIKDYYVDFDLKNLSQYLKGFSKPNNIATNDAIYAMIFTGESGTGKSTAARVIPYRCGIPFVSVNFSVNIEESDLFGTMIPNPNKKTSEDPEFIWQDGVITKAVRNGYCVILEELNFARPGVLGKLNSLLDETRQIDLQTGEIVKAHPYFKIIATCNISYEGTNSFNKALINRFEQCIEFNEMTSKELLAVIKSRTGYTDTTKIEKILVVYEALKKYSIEQNVNVVVSVRQLLTLFRQGKYCKDARDAVVNILINGAFIEEPEYKEEFLKAVLSSIDLSFKL